MARSPSTRKHRDALRRAVESPFLDDATRDTLTDLLHRLEPANRPPPGVSPGELELALMRATAKVIPAKPSPEDSNAWWARMGAVAASVRATVGDADLIGRWMGAQAWMTGPFTLEQVLKNWSTWATRARSEENAPARVPGSALGDPA